MGKIKKIIRAKVRNNVESEKKHEWLLRLVNIFGNNIIKVPRGNNIQVNGIIKKSHIRVLGIGNTIVINGELLQNMDINVQGNNNVIEIGTGSILLGGEIGVIDNDNKIKIGKNVGMQKDCRLISLEGRTIRIGDNCSISYDVELRTSDAHSLYKCEKGRLIRTNNADDVIIGDNCWLAQQTLILKGTNIGNDSVVGAKSLVSKLITGENCLIAGIPAKIIKNGVVWDHKRDQGKTCK